MALRYRKRIKIAPGIYINISKSGVSTTIGPRGASVNFGKNGTYVNAGIPGTGLYERQRIDKGSKQEKQYRDTKLPQELSHTSDSFDYNVIIIGVIAFLTIITASLFAYAESKLTCFFLLSSYLISLFCLLKLRQTLNKKEEVSTIEGLEETITEDVKEKLTSIDDTVCQIEKVVTSNDWAIDNHALEETNLTEERLLAPYNPKLDLEDYSYPTLDLLNHDDNNTATPIDMEEVRNKKNYIKTILSNFGVETLDNIKTTIGPAVTLYEITLKPGLSASNLKGLEEDLAIALSAKSVAINPIPWKGTIGIEVPNDKRQLVSMESIMNNRKFQETNYELPLTLGKTITNEPLIVDLAQMPHILIAGSTGQGKSVLLNVLIASLLYKKHPAELKLVLVDPRRLEFNLYSPIVNHFLAEIEDDDLPIITEAQQFVQTLKSLCKELGNRYELLEMASVKNVKEYNNIFCERQLNPQKGHRYLPYIVTVIDSFSDIAYGYEGEIRESLTKLVKLGRTVGIHIVLATGRPSSDIVTSEIKTYFPARIAFRLPERVDSRIILDIDGAERLLESGDMIFKLGTTIVRAQSAYIDTKEISNIVHHISKQQSYTFPYLLPDNYYEDNEENGFDSDMTHLDPMFEDAARLIISEQNGSTSMIQRKFSIGYNRAGRLMDQLEKAGIVSPAKGSMPRKVLCTSEKQLRIIIDNL
ncbi:MAG: DUF4236 domain-containing protein [Bacteroidaceae bacterium]|nr:DUF4236 domain-containing protein [Bacteroidaceae bacterium]